MKKNKGGRPTKMTDEVKDEICERIANGESLINILKSDPKFPTYPVVTAALRKDEEFLKQYARARDDQADYLAEEILKISDDGSNDTYVDEDGKLKVDYDHIQRSKLRVEARKWIASKLKPKKYGERVEQILTGEADKPVHHKIDISKLTDEELDREIAAAAQRRKT